MVAFKAMGSNADPVAKALTDYTRTKFLIAPYVMRSRAQARH